MRNLCAVAIAATLFATNVFAADAPLAPGTPAGLKHAQDDGDNTVLYIVGLGVIAAGIVLVASNGSGNNGSSGVVTPTTTK